MSLAGYNNVGALDIAMNDAVLMRLLQACSDLRGNVHCLGNLHGLPTDQTGKRGAFNVSHGEEELPIYIADVVDRANVRMLNECSIPCFFQESFALRFIQGIWWKKF